MLKIEDRHAEIDGKSIVRGLSLRVNAGEVPAVMAPHGAGKSTLGHVLGGRQGERPGDTRVTGNLTGGVGRASASCASGPLTVPKWGMNP